MELLTELTQTAATPGREHRVRKLIRERIEDRFDHVEQDALGSLICVRHPRTKAGKKRQVRNPTRVMVAAHMDQIGFLVKHIDDQGFLRVNPVGGFDTRNLFARLCTVCPDVNDPEKDLPGVMNPTGKPIHVASESEKNKVPTIDEFAVDLGLSAEQVKDRVKIGDMVVLSAQSREVGRTFVSQCLDNRVACWIAIRAAEKLEKLGHRCELHLVFTVQEEVGLRGAMTAAYQVKPDIGLALDTTLAIDTPGVSGDLACTRQGEGAALTVMDSASIADLELLETFEAVARKNQIKHQRSILTRGGTDAGTIQRAGVGVRTFTLSCPTRYIHTVTEMIHREDMNACRDLLAAYLAEA